MYKEEVVWGSWVQMRKARELNVLKLTCSSLFIGADWFWIFFFSYFNIPYYIYLLELKLWKKNILSEGLQEKWENKKKQWICQDKKNTQRIMGDSLDILQKI